jgi:hypothetical protein
MAFFLSFSDGSGDAGALWYDGLIVYLDSLSNTEFNCLSLFGAAGRDRLIEADAQFSSVGNSDLCRREAGGDQEGKSEFHGVLLFGPAIEAVLSEYAQEGRRLDH